MEVVSEDTMKLPSLYLSFVYFAVLLSNILYLQKEMFYDLHMFDVSRTALVSASNLRGLTLTQHACPPQCSQGIVHSIPQGTGESASWPGFLLDRDLF